MMLSWRAPTGLPTTEVVAEDPPRPPVDLVTVAARLGASSSPGRAPDVP
jgi:hypothetical protein